MTINHLSQDVLLPSQRVQLWITNRTWVSLVLSLYSYIHGYDMLRWGDILDIRTESPKEISNPSWDIYC